MLKIEWQADDISLSKGRPVRKLFARSRILPARHYQSVYTISFLYRGARIFLSPSVSTTNRYRFDSSSAISFHGLLVLIELPERHFAGHTEMRPGNESLRRHWQDYYRTQYYELTDKELNIVYDAFSDSPADAERLIRSDIPSLLHGLGSFHAPISLSAFDGRILLLMLPRCTIPFTEGLDKPASSNGNALSSRRKISAILGVIDAVLDRL